MSSSLVKRDTLLPAPGARSGLGRAERLRTGDGIQEFLVFTLGSERMALPLGSVKEILKPTSITAVPRAEGDVLGILSVRGRITTVIDLRRRLRMPGSGSTRHTRILLVDGGEEVMGLVVDAVLHVVRLREEEIEPAGIVVGDLPEHVTGLGRPRRREGARGAADGRARAGEAGGTEPIAARSGRGDVHADEASEAEVIVLLDPVALLERDGAGARSGQPGERR